MTSNDLALVCCSETLGDPRHDVSLQIEIHYEARGWAETIADFERTVGLSRLAAIHVNDSKKPRGSRVDRHEHIGRGTIGRRGFVNLMTDPRLAAIPKFLETPKDEDALVQDRKNLAVLRRLAT